MKFLIDKDIPFIKGVFEPYAEVILTDGSSMDTAAVRDASALIVRTRTRCDEALLSGSRVEIIATATIGTDHIDSGWCGRNGIEVASAPGCNAKAVAQYVFASIDALFPEGAAGKSLGIVGVGHVGGCVLERALSRGMKVLCCDPPRESSGEFPAEGLHFVTLNEVLSNADIVTLHVPLNDSTRGMADRKFFESMKSGACFINASRGPVIDDKALLDCPPAYMVIDTWNNEPDINPELLRITDIATPHIAGYSFQGKQNGTAMAVRAVARHFGIRELENYYPESIGLPNDIYDIWKDSAALKRAPDSFEELRDNYHFRNENN